MAFSKENLSVHVKSEQVVEDNLRSWLVSVEARISGESVALATVAKTVEVSCPVPDVEVECLGQPDQFTAIYRVHELNSNTELIDLPIKVKLMPRYNQQLENFYKLNSTLAGLVGRNYLVHPKYSITLVLDYARQKELIKDNLIICDDFLENLFESRWIKVRSVWDHLTRLMHKFEGECVNTTHKLDHELKVSTVEVKALQVDSATSSLYPVDWNSYQSNKFIGRRNTEAATKSSRSLKRHKTI